VTPSKKVALKLKTENNKQQIQMNYGSGTGSICAGQTLRVHSPGGSTFLRKRTWWTPF